jgi:hypothetical protein
VCDAALFHVRAFTLELRDAERTPTRLQLVCTAPRSVTAGGLWAGLRTRYPWVERSRLWRIEGATVGQMSTRQHRVQPSVPMSDRAFELLLERGGVMHPTPRPRPWLATWHYCPACGRLVRADRSRWWPGRRQAPNSFRGKGFGSSDFAAGPHPRGRVRSEVWRWVL